MAVLIVLLVAGCHGVRVEAWSHPLIDDPKFPQDYGLKISYTQEI